MGSDLPRFPVSSASWDWYKSRAGDYAVFSIASNVAYSVC